MPLPDGGEPMKSRVYDQLRSKQNSTIAATDFDTVREPIYLDGNSEDELRRLNLVGQITNMQSQSGVIPGSMSVEDVSIDSASTWTNLFTGVQGMVYECNQFGIGSIVNRTGDLGIYIRAYDIVNDKSIIVDLTTLSGSADTNLGDVDTPLYIDQNMKLDVYVTGTFDSLLAKVLIAKVR